MCIHNKTFILHIIYKLEVNILSQQADIEDLYCWINN